MWCTFALLGAFLWAVVNVINSVIVHHFEHRPLVLMGTQSLFTVSGLLLCFTVHPPLPSSWVPWYFLAGVLVFIGDRFFFVALRFMDVSLTNLAWVTASLFLSVLGILFLGERWTVLETAGAALIILGILYFSLWHQAMLSLRSSLLLLILAFLNTPFSLVQKMALTSGQGLYAVLLWPMLAREFLAFSSAWFSSANRRAWREALVRGGVPFLAWNGAAVACFVPAVLFLEMGNAAGPVSLVAIVANAQPFLVLSLAWAARQLFPHIALREAIQWEHVRVKLTGFGIVFVGLALLALSQ